MDISRQQSTTEWMVSVLANAGKRVGISKKNKYEYRYVLVLFLFPVHS
jgi:3-methyladenine DNA glycosylase Mpg